MTWSGSTTRLVKGNCTFTICAEPLSGETNTADNNLTSATVCVSICGDVNADGTVDIYDAIRLAGAFNSRSSSPIWNSNADINGDNVVDIYDAIILANNYGKTA
jgi:hypothetical protein